MKHNPDALLRAMAKGLEQCSQDASAPMLAVVLRALSDVSRENSKAAEDADLQRMHEQISPVWMKAGPQLQIKFLKDVILFSELMRLVAEAVSLLPSRIVDPQAN
jgi:hypothetical protein